MKETPYKDLNQGDTTKLPTKEITFPQRQVLAIMVNYKAQMGKYIGCRKIAQILSSINHIPVSHLAVYERMLALAKKGYITKVGKRYMPTVGAMNKIFHEVIEDS